MVEDVEDRGRERELPLLLRVAEAATLLSISRSKAYELISSGEMPGVVRIGGSIRISSKALRRWIDGEVQGDPPALSVGSRRGASEPPARTSPEDLFGGEVLK